MNRSLLQALYFCAPFREQLLEHYANNKADAEENLLTCLADLFSQVIMIFYGTSHIWCSNHSLIIFRLMLWFYRVSFDGWVCSTIYAKESFE